MILRCTTSAHPTSIVPSRKHLFSSLWGAERQEPCARLWPRQAQPVHCAGFTVYAVLYSDGVWRGEVGAVFRGDLMRG
jgi:hypothetical protein